MKTAPLLKASPRRAAPAPNAALRPVINLNRRAPGRTCAMGARHTTAITGLPEHMRAGLRGDTRLELRRRLSARPTEHPRARLLGQTSTEQPDYTNTPPPRGGSTR